MFCTGSSTKLEPMTLQVLVARCTLSLKLIGLHPQNTSRFSKFRVFMTILIVLLYTLLNVMYIVFQFDGIQSLDGTADSVAATMQILAKLGTLYYSRETVKTMFRKMAKFWDAEAEQSIHENIQKNYTIMQKLCTSIIGVVIVTASIYFVRVLITNSEENRQLPLSIYAIGHVDLSSSPYFEIAFIFEAVATSIGGLVIIAFDTLIVTCVGAVICQFRIIQYKLVDLGKGEELENNHVLLIEEFRVIVKHHDFILKFVDDLKDFYSVNMLIQFTSNCFTICVALFFLGSGSFPPPSAVVAKYVPFLFCFGGQLLMLCYVGNEITLQSLGVADAAYDSGWWLKVDSKVSKEIILLIQRAQKRTVLTAGGMFDLNLQNFFGIVKLSFSFYTLLSKIYGGDKVEN